MDAHRHLDVLDEGACAPAPRVRRDPSAKEGAAAREVSASQNAALEGMIDAGAEPALGRDEPRQGPCVAHAAHLSALDDSDLGTGPHVVQGPFQGVRREDLVRIQNEDEIGRSIGPCRCKVLGFAPVSHLQDGDSVGVPRGEPLGNKKALVGGVPANDEDDPKVGMIVEVREHGPRQDRGLVLHQDQGINRFRRLIRGDAASFPADEPPAVDDGELLEADRDEHPEREQGEHGVETPRGQEEPSERERVDEGGAGQGFDDEVAAPDPG